MPLVRLTVKTNNVIDVADAIHKGKTDIQDDYDKSLADNHGTVGSITVVDVQERSHSIVVVVDGPPDICPRTLLNAVASVVPSHIDAKYHIN